MTFQADSALENEQMYLKHDKNLAVIHFIQA